MKVSHASAAIANGVLLYSNVATAANSTDALKSETSPIAKNLMNIYTTNQTTTGVLAAPYSWSEAATLFSTMINYAFYTGDTTYSDTVSKGLVLDNRSAVIQHLASQIGSSNDFAPSTESSSELNSDQSAWALASMSAIETGFENPSDSSKTGWLGFAENVFNEQVIRWKASSSCNGGLSSGISDAGDEKDGLSNGEFFALAGRLARYTANDTFGDWAETVWDWAEGVGLVSGEGEVFESTSSGDNCSSLNKVQWSADAGAFVLGSAHMYNFTNGASTWKTRLTTLLTTTLKTFTPDGDGIIIEAACERSLNCTTPQLSYKSLLASSLLDTLTVAPFTASTITPVLQSSADAAVKSCDTSDGTCGTQWTWGKYDGLTGAGQEMAALVVMQGLLVNGTGGFKDGKNGASPTTTGGSGAGASGSGTSTSSSASATNSKKSGAEKVVLGSSILLGVVAVVFVGLL